MREEGSLEGKRTENGGQWSQVNPLMATAAAVTLVPGLTGAAWIHLGYAWPVGVSWMAGLAAAAILAATAEHRADRAGRKGRWDFAKTSFLGAMGGCMASGMTLTIMGLLKQAGS